jgi:hypothetical protein
MAPSADGQRPARDPWSIGFGAVVLVSALLALTVWFPNDIKGGFIDLNQVGMPEPGDAFFPVILAGMLLVLSVAQLLGALFGRRPQAPSGKLTAENLKFLFLFYAIVLIALTVMYWLGPLVVETLRSMGAIDQTYRQLVDTRPYKYLGYVAGGFIMSVGLIAWAEGRVRRTAVLSVVIVQALLIFILDVLLRNIQLPPNADF